MKYPASTTALPLITISLTAFLVDNGWPNWLAAGIGVLAGAAPFAAAKISEWREDR